MKNLVKYEGDNIVVDSSTDRDVVVYAHPGNKIHFSLDISHLDKKIVNNDLVITLSTGVKITIANYAIMAINDQAPVLLDGTDIKYQVNDFLVAGDLQYTATPIDKVVITRKIATPSSNEIPGKNLAHTEHLNEHESDKNAFVGTTPVDEQSPVVPTSTDINTYQTLTLHQPGKQKYDVDKTFAYTNKTLYNQNQDGTDEIKVVVVRPTISAYYGAKVTVDKDPEGSTESSRSVSHGGGSLNGDNDSKYQYTPETLDYSSSSQSLTYFGDSTDTIYRGLNVMVKGGSDMQLRTIKITGLSGGIELIGGVGSVVTPTGTGSYKVDVSGGSDSLDLFIKYNAGSEDLFTNAILRVDGYNSKLDSLFSGMSKFNLDLKEVHSAADILNYTNLNTFTFSTLIDPLSVRMTSLSDIIHTGKVRDGSIFSLGSGDDIFYQDQGSAIVHMENGSNTFYMGNASAIVDAAPVDNDVNTVDWQNGVLDAIEDKADILLGNGIIQIKTNHNGQNNVNSFTGIGLLYLDGQSGRDNTISLGSTQGLNGLKLSGRGGNDSIVISGKQTVSLDMTNAKITTNGGADYIYFDTADKSINIFDVGSSSLNFIGSLDYNVVVKSNTTGKHIYHYDNLGASGLTGITYYAVADATHASGTVVKMSAENFDIISNVTQLWGTLGDDTFYASGSGVGTSYYGGKNLSSAGDADLISYTYETKNGVTIDLTHTTDVDDARIEITKSNGNVDVARYISQIEASQANDKFIVADDGATVLDGLKGDADTLSYEKVVQTGITVNIDGASDYGVTGTVIKGKLTDTFTNINSIIDSAKDDTFNVGTAKQALTLSSTTGGEDTISYAYGDMNTVSVVFNVSEGTVKKGDQATDKISGFANFKSGSADDTIVVKSVSDFTTISYKNIDLGGSTEATVGDYSKLGNRVQIQDAYTGDGLSPLVQKVSSVDTLQFMSSGNIINISESLATESTGPLFKNIIANYDASNANLVSFSSLSSALTVTVGDDASTPSFVVDTGGTLGSLGIQGFTTIQGSRLNDTFNVNADNSAKISYEFDGNAGSDIIDYSSTKSTYLTIDLNNADAIDNYQISVKKGDGSTDWFTIGATVKGGNGGNIFILNPSASTVISGGDGYDTVSYEHSTAPITSIPTDSFTNIEAITLTSFDDNIAVDDAFFSEAKYNIEGGQGDDTFDMSAVTTSLDIDVGAKNDHSGLLEVKIGDMFIRNFEHIMGSSSSGNVFNISTWDNSSFISVAGSDVDSKTGYNLYIDGGSSSDNKIDYSKLEIKDDQGVTFNFSYTDPDSNLDYMYVNKQNNSTDYFRNIQDITLTDGNDTILFDVSYDNTANPVTLHTGGGNDILDFSLNTGVNVDFDKNTVTSGDTSKDIYVDGFNSVVGTDANDTFIMSSKNKYSVDAGEGTNTADFSNFTSGLYFNIATHEVKNGDDSGEKVGDFSNFQAYKGTSGDDMFIGSADVNVVIDGNGGNDTLSYESIESSSAYTFSYNTATNSGSVRKQLIGNSVDSFSNIKNIIGTKGNDTFSISGDASDDVYAIRDADLVTIDGGEGTNTLYISNTSSYTKGLTFDLNAGCLKDNNSGNTLFNLKNFQVLQGTSLSDTFVLKQDETTFRVGSNIDGINSDDGSDTNDLGDNANIIDMSHFDNSASYTVDLSSSHIFNSSDDTNYLVFSNIHEILMGDGDDTLILSSVASTVKAIDGGGGNNTISLLDSTSPATGDISDLNFGSSSVKLTHFSSYSLTNFDDSIIVSKVDESYSVDGGLGTDSIDYSSFKDLEINVSEDGSYLEVTRGNEKDTIKNFEIIKLASDTNTINIGNQNTSFQFISPDASKTSLSYAVLDQGSLRVDVSTGNVVKNLDAGVFVDTFTGVQSLTLGKNSDSLYLSDTVIGGKITSMDINLGGGDSNVLDFTKSSTGITYTTSDTGIVAKVGDISYNMTMADGTAVSKVNGTSSSDTFMLSKITGTRYIGNGATEGADIANYSSVASAIVVDFAASSVYLTDSQDGKQDVISGIYTVVGAAGKDNQFINLSNLREYNLDGNGGLGTVDYGASTASITVTMSSDGKAVVDKGGIQDTLKDIASYVGTKYNDTFVVDYDYIKNNGGKGSIDGGAGINTLSIENATKAMVVVYDPKGGTTIDDYQFNFTRFQDFKLTDQADTFTYVVSTGSLSVDGAGGVNTFNLKAGDNTVVLQYDWTNLSGKVEGKSSDGDYNVSFSNFQTMSIESTSSSTVSLTGVDFSNTDAQKNISFDFSKAESSILSITQYTNLTDWTLDVNNKLWMNGTTVSVENIHNITFGAPTDSSTTLVTAKIQTGEATISFASALSLDISTIKGAVVFNAITISANDGKLKVILNNLEKSDITVAESVQITGYSALPASITTKGTDASFDMVAYKGSLGVLSFEDSGINVSTSGSDDTAATSLSGFMTYNYGGTVKVSSFTNLSDKTVINGQTTAKLVLDSALEKDGYLHYSTDTGKVSQGNDADSYDKGVKFNINDVNIIDCSSISTVSSVRFSLEKPGNLTEIDYKQIGLDGSGADGELDILGQASASDSLIIMNFTLNMTDDTMGFSAQAFINGSSLSLNNLRAVGFYEKASSTDTVKLSYSGDIQQFNQFNAAEKSVGSDSDHNVKGIMKVATGADTPRDLSIDFSGITNSKPSSLNQYEFEFISPGTVDNGIVGSFFTVDDSAKEHDILDVLDLSLIKTIYLPSVVSKINFSKSFGDQAKNPVDITFIGHVNAGVTNYTMFKTSIHDGDKIDLFSYQTTDDGVYVNSSIERKGNTLNLENINMFNLWAVENVKRNFSMATHGLDNSNMNRVYVDTTDSGDSATSITMGGDDFSSAMAMSFSVWDRPGTSDTQVMTSGVTYNKDSSGVVTGLSDDWIADVSSVLKAGKYDGGLGLTDYAEKASLASMSLTSSFHNFYGFEGISEVHMTNSNSNVFSFGKSGAGFLLAVSQNKISPNYCLPKDIYLNDTTSVGTLTYDALNFNQNLYDGNVLSDIGKKGVASALSLSYDFTVGDDSKLVLNGWTTAATGLKYGTDSVGNDNLDLMLQALKNMTFHNASIINFDDTAINQTDDYHVVKSRWYEQDPSANTYHYLAGVSQSITYTDTASSSNNYKFDLGGISQPVNDVLYPTTVSDDGITPQSQAFIFSDSSKSTVSSVNIFNDTTNIGFEATMSSGNKVIVSNAQEIKMSNVDSLSIKLPNYLDFDNIDQHTIFLALKSNSSSLHFVLPSFTSLQSNYIYKDVTGGPRIELREIDSNDNETGRKIIIDGRYTPKTNSSIDSKHEHEEASTVDSVHLSWAQMIAAAELQKQKDAEEKHSKDLPDLHPHHHANDKSHDKYTDHDKSKDSDKDHSHNKDTDHDKLPDNHHPVHETGLLVSNISNIFDADKDKSKDSDKDHSHDKDTDHDKSKDSDKDHSHDKDTDHDKSKDSDKDHSHDKDTDHDKSKDSDKDHSHDKDTDHDKSKDSDKDHSHDKDTDHDKSKDSDKDHSHDKDTDHDKSKDSDKDDNSSSDKSSDDKDHSHPDVSHKSIYNSHHDISHHAFEVSDNIFNFVSENTYDYGLVNNNHDNISLVSAYNHNAPVTVSSSMTDMLNIVSENMLEDTAHHDEASSMSYALDSDMSVGGEHGDHSHSVADQKKHHNDGGFGSSS